MSSTPQYWTIVKFDLICKEFERQFHEYYDTHIREWAAKSECSRAWRFRELRGAANQGLLEQEFAQVYEVSNPCLFEKPRPIPPATEDKPWLRDRSNWGRILYRLEAGLENKSSPGQHWVRFEMDFRDSPQNESAFKVRCARAIEAAMSLPGVYRAWQLRYVPHEILIGARPAAPHMIIYEIDSPERLLSNQIEKYLPLLANDRGVTLVSRHFSRVLLSVSNQSAE